MPVKDLLGRVVTLPVLRFGSPGAFLAVDPNAEGPGGETLLLLGAEIREGQTEGDELEVFVYLDSSDRPIATTSKPKIMLGEVAFLEVTDLVNFGAFFDWGLPRSCSSRTQSRRARSWWAKGIRSASSSTTPDGSRER